MKMSSAFWRKVSRPAANRRSEALVAGGELGPADPGDWHTPAGTLPRPGTARQQLELEVAEGVGLEALQP